MTPDQLVHIPSWLCEASKNILNFITPSLESAELVCERAMGTMRSRWVIKSLTGRLPQKTYSFHDATPDWNKTAHLNVILGAKSLGVYFAVL